MSQQRELVRIEGRWHVVSYRDAEKVKAACSKTRRKSAVELSPEGEKPDGLSGTTICYDCARRVEQ